MTTSVYLAGPIHGCTDDEVHCWRDAARDALPGYEIHDPSRRDFRGVESGADRIIVEGDKLEIASSSLVLAMVPAPSIGTSMEILWAWSLRIPVVTVSSHASPWLRYHSTAIYPHLTEALHHIRSMPFRDYADLYKRTGAQP